MCIYIVRDFADISVTISSGYRDALVFKSSEPYDNFRLLFLKYKVHDGNEAVVSVSLECLHSNGIYSYCRLCRFAVFLCIRVQSVS